MYLEIKNVRFKIGDQTATGPIGNLGPPQIGTTITILGNTWKIVSVNYDLDNSTLIVDTVRKHSNKELTPTI